jgi:hypothetical protein
VAGEMKKMNANARPVTFFAFMIPPRSKPHVLRS